MFCAFTLTFAVVCVQCPLRFFFLHFLNFVLFCYVAQLLYEWFLNGSGRPYYCWYRLCFHFPHALNFCYEVCVFYNLHGFFLDHISVSRNCNIYWHACSFFIITDYDVRFILRVLLFIIIIIIIIIICRHTAFGTSVNWFYTVITFRTAVQLLSFWISLSVGPYLKVAKPARPGDKGYTSRPYGVSRTNLLSSSSLAACWPPGCWYMTLRGRGSQGTMSVITRCMQLINNGGAKSHKVNVYCFYMLFVCGFKISLHCILIIVQTSVSSRDVAWLIHNKSVLQRNYILIFVLASFFLSFLFFFLKVNYLSHVLSCFTNSTKGPTCPFLRDL